MLKYTSTQGKDVRNNLIVLYNWSNDFSETAVKTFLRIPSLGNNYSSSKERNVYASYTYLKPESTSLLKVFDILIG